MIAGRYSLVSEVGRGGMGVVWRGVDEVLERDVALKRVGMIPGGASPDLARAEREARLAASLNHPNVVAVFDLVTDKDEQWLVMEYVENQTLAQLVRERGPLSPDEVAPYLHQAASALAAAHQAGIVHRDVKPSNILVTSSGQVKLTDFGIARAHADVTLTQTGLMSGSPAYLAPEVASGGTAGAASDVWALGATLFHALTGHPPFEVGNNVMGALYQIVHEDPPRPDNAGWLLPLLEATMTKDPADRWSMVDVRDFLGRPSPIHATPPPMVDEPTMMMAAPPTHVQPVEPAAAARPAPPDQEEDEDERSKRWLVPVLLAAAVVVLLGLGGWALMPGDGQRPDTTAGEPSASASEGTGDTGSDPGSAPGAEGSPDESLPEESESPEESDTPDGATEEGMSAFVDDYLATVTSDPDTTWTWLTPEFQNDSGGIDKYKGYWGTIQSAELEDVTADPSSMTVTYTATYTRTDGTVVTEDNTLELVMQGDRYLIAGEA